LDLKKVPKDQRPCYDSKCDIWSAGVIVYILLSGYPPFFDENRKKLFQKIKAGRFEFHPNYWSDTSIEAKDLISKMLTVDPSKRLSAKELLSHPWIFKSDESLSEKDLKGTQLELKRFNARRRFKAAVNAVLAAQRLANSLDFQPL
jgi:serine/threonine protein kinase